MSKPITKPEATSHSDRPVPGGFFSPAAAKLHLSDGSAFTGLIPAKQPDSLAGEVVFNTGMTGYVETLTDPSYAGQILVFTYPLIGNYGVPASGIWESPKIHLRGVIVSELTAGWSHATGQQSLLEWLTSQGVPVITGVDTRALTKHLRERGTMTGLISNAEKPPITLTPVSKISITKPEILNPKYPHTIIAVDCGMKQNILRHLTALPYRIKRVPHDYDYTAENYAGILISNGPGDPQDYSETIAVLKKALAKGKPIFGICLGTQVLALAAGAKTYKLRYGHRGHNQPVIEVRKGQVDAAQGNKAYITSQNHGYAIAEDSLPAGWSVTFRNLNDQSVEGISHATKPFSAVQFHPEAAPGPTDTAWLFKNFEDQL